MNIPVDPLGSYLGHLLGPYRVGVGATEEWKARLHTRTSLRERQVAAGETPGGFVVYAGDLGFSVHI